MSQAPASRLINWRCSSSSGMASPAAAFSVALLGFDVAGIDTVVAGWLSPHCSKRLAPGVDAEGLERCEFGGGRRGTHQIGGSERAHDQHTEPELGGQWQQASSTSRSCGLYGIWMASRRPVTIAASSSSKLAAFQCVAPTNVT